jgi:DNA-binding beta-propeller fold protein YncE
MSRLALFCICAALASIGVAYLASGAEGPTLAPRPPILIPRAPGFFDYMQVDDQYRRLLVAHTASHTLDIIDLTNDSLARQVDVGEAHGIAVDIKDGRYFIGSSRPEVVADVQRKFMVKQSDVSMPGPIDAVALDTKNDALYADRSDTGQVVVMDAKSHRILANIQVGARLEYVLYDAVTDKVYQNVVSADQVAVIDPAKNTVIATWPAAPAAQLRGLAVDGATHRLFVAGGNGKLDAMDTTSGAVIATADIAPGVDQIAFDPVLKRIYCASGTGIISVVAETETGIAPLADVTVPRRAHTVAVDPTTHNVWISYGAEDNDYVMKLVQVVPTPPPSPAPIPSSS